MAQCLPRPLQARVDYRAGGSVSCGVSLHLRGRDPSEGERIRVQFEPTDLVAAHGHSCLCGLFLQVGFVSSRGTARTTKARMPWTKKMMTLRRDTLRVWSPGAARALASPNSVDGVEFFFDSRRGDRNFLLFEFPVVAPTGASSICWLFLSRTRWARGDVALARESEAPGKGDGTLFTGTHGSGAGTGRQATSGTRGIFSGKA